MRNDLKTIDYIFLAVGFVTIYGFTGNFVIGLLFSFLFIPIGRALASEYNLGGASGDDKLNYTNEILALVSVILTKDKKILKSELNYVKRFLNHNFSEEEAREYLIKFREYTKKNLSIEKICANISYALDNSEKRQILHLIIGAAVAERELTEAELIDVYRIGQYLRINKITVDSLLSMHSFNYTGRHQQSRYQRQSNQQQYRRRTSKTSLNQAYRILEITPQATESEIKKAYRKLAVIYHPDKVMNMGESHQKSAKEKFQTIQAAYDQIKETRGIK